MAVNNFLLNRRLVLKTLYTNLTTTYGHFVNYNLSFTTLHVCHYACSYMLLLTKTIDRDRADFVVFVCQEVVIIECGNL